MVTRTVSTSESNRRGWRWAVLGALLGGLLALAFYAPARWLAAGLSYWTGGHLQMVNARGTVWNGDAGLVFSSGAGGAEPISLPGNIDWTLRPRWDGVVASLDIPCCAAEPLVFRARPRANGLGLEWRDGQSTWPAALLTGFGAPWNTLKPEGTLKISMQGLRMQFEGNRLLVDGNAILEATDISSSLSTLKPMGSYRLALAG
ncbi:MAG: type II secretion system protein N, partial [Gammaproteobacteria bacterium]|nr:type II secretion system protein N [Gammaproteobacteria bacterium]